jgi:alkylmercury lyase
MARAGDNVSLAALADGLAGTFPGCEDAPLARALLRALARGKPVSTRALADATGRDESEVSALLVRWPNVHRDREGQIVAFGGLSLVPTLHRFQVGGRRLYTWCAWDTLFLPALLDEPASVESACPVTRTAVDLTVAPERVLASDPEDVRVSFPPPGRTSTEDITGSFCCHVHFIAGEAAATCWLAGHDGGLVLSLEDAFELGRLATRACRTPGPAGGR